MRFILIKLCLSIALSSFAWADYADNIILRQAGRANYPLWLEGLDIPNPNGCHVKAARSRLDANDFNTLRLLVTTAETAWHTSVQDTLSAGLIGRLRKRETRRVLDSGCGSCGAAVHLFDPQFREFLFEYFGLAFSMNGVNQTNIVRLQEEFEGRFHLLTGHFAEDHPALRDLKFDEVMDSNGPFAYTRHPNELIQVYGGVLLPGKVLDTMYDSHMLVRLANGEEVILPNFQVIDEDNLDVTELWFSKIEGFRSLDESKVVRPSFIPGHRYLNVRERIERARISGVLPKDVFVDERDGLTFIRSGLEIINVSKTVALERTQGKVWSPPLEEVFFADGRPPVRVFLWRRR